MSTRVGFFIFAGLTFGALFGEFVAFGPGPGAVGGGVLGVVLALLLDYMDSRKQGPGEGNG